MNQNIIQSQQTAREALEKLNNIGSKRFQTLFVIDESNILIGSLTDGDIRRGLLAGKEISNSVVEFVNRSSHYLNEDEVNTDSVLELLEKGIEWIPILSKKKLIRIIDAVSYKGDLPLDVLIMAGGKGKRLLPLTKDTPKPLLKVGDKPIIDYSVDSLISFGIKNITISLNHFHEQIENHFNSKNKNVANFSFVKEDGPLGTAGALGLLNEIENDHLLMMNSDLLTNINFAGFYKFYREQNADMAIAAVPYNVSVPYAVLESEGHVIKNLKEKPVYTYYSNAGIYLLNKKIIQGVKKNEYLDATDLIQSLIESGGKVVIYHLLDYWLDIGRMEDFKKAQEDIHQLKFY